MCRFDHKYKIIHKMLSYAGGGGSGSVSIPHKFKGWQFNPSAVIVSLGKALHLLCPVWL